MATEKGLVYASDVRREILSAEPRLAYIVDRVKTVDAVEVVRCKDCKHRYTMSSGMSFCKKNFLMGAKDNDFCSYGERRCDNEAD